MLNSELELHDMKLGARVSFDTVEELNSHFEGVDFPVELALPYQVDRFLLIAERMDEVRDFIKEKGIEVLSVHAAQGNLIGDSYKQWAEPAMWIADQLGARCVTFHPNQRKANRLAGQEIAIKHLNEIQKGRKAAAGLETFGGKRRAFHPEEIVELSLPLVLDTAHLHDDGRILGLISSYHPRIAAVHLSARGENEHHLPIDSFCLEVVSLLAELKWNGGIVLEYLPWHHYRVRGDLQLLRRFLAGERNIKIPPPDDKFRNNKQQWGFVQGYSAHQAIV